MSLKGSGGRLVNESQVWLFCVCFHYPAWFVPLFIRAVLTVRIVKAINSNGERTLILLYISCMIRCVHPTVQVGVTCYCQRVAHTWGLADLEGRLETKPLTTTVTAFKLPSWIMFSFHFLNWAGRKAFWLAHPSDDLNKRYPFFCRHLWNSH